MHTHEELLIEVIEIENLYNEERKLLQRLVESNSRKEQEILKRMIGRLNKEMEKAEGN